ncbi:MAG: hypothetical protein ABL933_03095 [Methyloglobulus sp.]|nr:hypothetical protein [Methyloglobulus sp.]
MHLNNAPRISKFGLLCILLFYLGSFLGRFLFPFGDEPDFSVRARVLTNGTEELPFWSPYSFLFKIFQNIEVETNCVIESAPFSLWSLIDDHSCTESLSQIFYRFTIVVFITLPLAYCVIFRQSFIKLVSLIKYELPPEEWQNKLDSVAISLTLPSTVYYLGLLSHEQLTLAISLFVLIFWDSLPVVLFLIALTASIDPGNAIIILLFTLIGKTGELMNRTLKPFFFDITLVCALIFAYVIGFSILEILPLNYLGIGQKAESLIHLFSNGIGVELIDKYPKIFRPVITFMTLIFMTPSFVKVVLGYVLVFILLLVAFMKAFLTKNSCKKKQLITKSVLLKSMFATTVIFIFLFPTHTNGKYYIFLMPFFISFLLNIYKKEVIAFFSMLIALTVYLNIFLYRI